MTKLLRELKTGSAFYYNGVVYIAFCLSPDPFDVFCLNTITREIVELDETTPVNELEHWFVMPLHHNETTTIGKDLEML